MKEKAKNITKWVCLSIIIFCCIYLIIAVILSEAFKGIILKKGLAIKKITNIEYNNGEIYAQVETYKLITNKELWCIATDSEYTPNPNENWQKVEENKCTIKIKDTDKYIYIKDNNNEREKIRIADHISGIAKIEFNNQYGMKLIEGETKKIDITLRKIGNPDTRVKYAIENEEIAKIEKDTIVGIKEGTTKLTISDNYGNSEAVDVTVTTLLTLPQINNSKPYISNKQYTQEEAKLLDEYLFAQIDEAGYETRAGVVAAARFLSLEFKYRIPYFIENGRITHFNHQRPYCDGEGRYYHRGLYLSEDKFASIEKSVAGPAMWGAYIKEWSEDNGIIRNGLDCSGFVCWCLINGGFDFGDIGGGLSEGGIPTLSDRGISHKITMEYLEQGTVKAGDLIGYDGHIGIIIGVENGYIYTADTLFHSKGLVATKFSYRELVNNSYFTHIYDYTDEYKAEGNYTEMW